MDSPKIDLARLREYISRAFDELEQRFPNGVAIHEATYWEVPITKQFDFTRKEPPPVVVGDLVDDLEFLESAMQSGCEILPTSLYHASALLSYLATHAQDSAETA